MNGHAFKKYSNLKNIILIVFVTGDFVATPISYVYYLSFLIEGWNSLISRYKIISEKIYISYEL